MNYVWRGTCVLPTNTLSEQEYRELARWHAEVAADHARRATNPHCTVIIEDHRFDGLSAAGRTVVADFIWDHVRDTLGDYCLYCAVDPDYCSDGSLKRMRVRITTSRSSLRHE